MRNKVSPGGIIIPGQYEEPKEGIDWEYVDNEDNALVVRIKTGPWKDIQYVYQYVSLIAPPAPPPKDEFDDIDAKYNMVDEEEETARLKFDYVVLDNPLKAVTKHSHEFELLLGDILAAILWDAVTNSETKFSMVSKSDKGKIEGLQPLKDGKIKDKLVKLNTPKSGGISGALRKAKNLIFGR
jgi:hypothetical protein